MQERNAPDSQTQSNWPFHGVVAEGDVVARGTVVERLDNDAQLANAVLQAEANLAVRQATLVQTRALVASSQAEAAAGLEQAHSVQTEAQMALDRAQDLFGRGVVTQATLDADLAADRQAAATVEKANATLARFATTEPEAQPDVIVAQRNLEAAGAELACAHNDLTRAADRGHNADDGLGRGLSGPHFAGGFGAARGIGGDSPGQDTARPGLGDRAYRGAAGDGVG